MRPPRPIVALLAGLLLCGAPASCTSKRPPPGEVMAVVTTDLSVPKDIDTLHVSVLLTGGEPILSKDYPLQGPGALSLPGTLGVVAGPHTTEPVTIQVSGLLQGVPRVSREATVTLPTDRVAMLPMPLDWLCMGTPCPPGETCQAGTCVSDVDTPIREDYVPPSPADGGADDGGKACFDTSACFASAVLWTASSLADCTIPKPMGSAAVNVALVVVGGAGICSRESCLVPLDAESAEGWQTSPDGTRIDLPPAVCTNSNVSVEVTTACPTKPANAAICPGLGSPIVAGGCVADTDSGCPDGYVCDPFGGQAECVRINSSTGVQLPGKLAVRPCLPDSTVLCAGGATGYLCMPRVPLLQCGQLRSDNVCGISGWCCVSAGDAGTCTVDAGEGGVLIDDMSGQTAACSASQPKSPIMHAGDTAGYWYANDDGTGSGSMVPVPHTEFTYTPVTATCFAPFSNAACIKSVTPYVSFAYAPLMGFQFEILGANPDGGNATPAAYSVSPYRGIQFWAMASDTGATSVTVQFSDAPNDAAFPGAACEVNPPYKCFNYYQYTQRLTSTWAPYEVDFDMLSQRLDAGLNTTPMFVQSAALAINFMVAGVTPLTFDLCVAQIYFVPK